MKLKVIFLIPKQKLTKAEKLETELKKKIGRPKWKNRPEFLSPMQKNKTGTEKATRKRQKQVFSEAAHPV